VNALITAGAELTIPPNASNTPLQMAVETGTLEIVNALIAAQVDVNAVVAEGSNAGATPLQIACAEGKIDIINALLAAKATTDIPDNAGQTPMSVANIAGKVDVIGLLVTAGANVNTVVDNGENNMPQLQYASVKGDINTVNAILAGSPDLNAVDELTGSTALIAASKAGKTDAVKALIAAGADVSLANGDGETALSLAQKPEIKAALTTAGAVGGRRTGKSRKSRKSRKAKGRRTRGKGRKA
jgi:ankyrin repeat protein